MKMEDFLSGNDVQRSLNLADSKCINLYPTTNDKGDVTAFYSTPGLLAYTSAASAFSGLYTASNGRCFGVSGTTLYEITTGGVLTNRGTVTTATVSKMSDNGIELIIVNSTDAWLFIFATNALKKISTLSADFTVTIASPAVFSTVAAHGLIAGDAIQLTTTTGSNTTSGVLTASTSSPITAPNYSTSVISSPDNQYVYIAANDGYIYQYLRDSVSGDLSPLSPPYATNIYGAPQASNLEMSPDGNYIYAINLSGIFLYSRNASTGIISNISIEYNFFGDYITSIKVSSDGLFFYMTTRNGITGLSYVHQFSRSITGVLTPLSPATIALTYNVNTSMAISSDAAGVNQSVYILSASTNLIQCFNKNNATPTPTGLLTAIASVATGAGAVSIIVSHDNLHVYVNCTNAIKHYTRVPATGVITLADTLTTTLNPSQLVISADDTSVYASSPDGVVMEFDRNTTTGVLTAMSTPTVPAAGTINAIAITANGKSVYAMSYGPVGASFTYMFQRQQSSSNVGLPTGLDTLTTYYVIAAGLTATNFEVSLTVGGTAVNTSGVQAGIHTFHTLGNGFPNGAKTVSYIDGRFVVCQPNTQNFYVSNVLQGGTWDALNVQTADSNPDMIVGQITLHNELIVFCEQSGETFYDSGTYPAPFVRNVSGIFEVGCIAPYSIAKIDNSVMWLGRSNTGQGVIYRLNGYTPVRLSTYAIEYAIQTMTTISDAMAFTYQQEGHHFYVITFPTGNRTFAFDVNTGLWHERAGWNGSILSRWAAKEYAYFDGKHLICDYASGNIYSLDLGVYTDGANAKKWIRSWRAPASEMKRVIHNKLTLEAEVGVGPGSSSQTGVVNSINIDNPGTSGAISMLWNINTIPSGTYKDCVWNGSIMVAVGTNICSTSPDGVTWTTRTIPAGNYTGVSWNGAVFCAISPTVFATSSDGITWVSNAGFGTTYTTSGISYGAGVFCIAVVGYSGFGYYPYTFTSTNGINWTLQQSFGSAIAGASAGITYSGSLFFVTIYLANAGTYVLWSSSDGITFTSRATITSFSGHSFVAYSGSVYVYVGNGTAYLTSTDGITWTPRTFPASLFNAAITYNSGLFCVSHANSSTVYTSPDGITWTTVTSTSSAGHVVILTNGSYFIAIPYTTSTDVLTSYFAYPSAGTYAITFTGGGGSGAAGTYTISPTTGQIVSTLLTNGGANYTTAPILTFIYGGITGAIGHAGMTWTQIDVPTGTATVSLKYSNDGGHTWSADNWRDMSLGVIGQYSKRVYWYRLGMTTGQVRLYEISSTSPVKTVLLSTYLE